MTDYYLDTEVVGGADDGTSWANAWSDPADLPAALSSGDRLFLNAPFGNPIRSTEAWGADDPIIALGAGSNFDIYCNQGDDGVAWIRNAWKTTWSDEGGGVFSYVTDEPLFVVYDYKQDDDEGTVTGCDFTTARIAQLIDRWGLNVNDLIPYYGFLEDGGATTTPSAGQWGYTGGTLYINPPGSPSNATVNSLAEIIDESRDGMEITQCSNFTLHPGLRTILTPGEAATNDGYAVRGNGCTNSKLKGVRSYCSGQHATSFAGTAPDSNSGHSNQIIGCISVGCHGDVGTIGNPYVFYQDGSSATSIANHVGQNLVAINVPMFLHDGTPLNDTAGNGLILQSHSDGGVTDFGPITWRRVLGIDFLEQIDTKHSSSLSAYGDSCQGKQLADPSTKTDPDDYLIRVYDSAFVGHLVPTDIGATYHERVLWDNAGTSAISGTAPWNGNADDGVVYSYFVDCVWIGGEVPNQMMANIGSTDHITMKNCKLLMSSVTSTKDGWFYLISGAASDVVVLENVQVDYTDPASQEKSLFKANPTAWNDNLSSVTSNGGNILGDDMDGWVYHTNTGAVPTPRDLSWWQSNVGANDSEATVSITSLELPTNFLGDGIASVTLGPKLSTKLATHFSPVGDSAV